MSSAAKPEDRHSEPVGRPLLVLIADDGSQAAAASTAMGLRIAGRTHGTAVLLHAEQDPAERGHWERHLVSAAEYGPAHATTRTMIQRGDPVDVILRVATTERADLICVGAAGEDQHRESVSREIVERAPCPVLVCRQGVEISPSHISAVVVGVHRSEDALVAVHLAELLAEVFDATLVAPLPPMPELRERLADGSTLVEDIARGAPDQTLVNALQRHAPAILVLDRPDLDSSTGRLGQPTRDMLATAPGPVLVTPRRAPTLAARPQRPQRLASIATKQPVFTLDEARRLGEAIGIDWPTSRFGVDEFRVGLDVELEHGRRDPETNVTDDDRTLTAKIARAHLNEFPDYYTRLARLEADAERFWNHR